MKIVKMLLITAVCFSPVYAYALNVGTVTTILPSDKKLVGKKLTNDADSARLVTIQVHRIDSPRTGGKAINFETDNELLLSPKTMMLSAYSSNIVKFYYQGPADDKERYYRLSFDEESIAAEIAGSTSDKSGHALTKLHISTILVVQPRKKVIDFGFVDGEIINKGNTSFRVTAQGECINEKFDNPCREAFFVMPKTKKTFNVVNSKGKNSHIGLWDMERYIPIR